MAIKVIRTDLFGPTVLKPLLKRFERGARALAKFDHPNIVGIYDFGEFNESVILPNTMPLFSLSIPVLRLRVLSLMGLLFSITGLGTG